MQRSFQLLCLWIGLLGLFTTQLKAQEILSTEKRFQELFITAGYSTALGAALGAATMGLSADPSGKMRYIAFGASLGFISGSLLGSYLALFPVIVDSNPTQTLESVAWLPSSRSMLTLSPVWNRSEHRISEIQASLVLLRF